jgi:hypothetical protein
MSIDSFYEIVAGICFALCGLWWTVVERRKDWITDQTLRSLSGGVYASFLIPAVMSLGAQIGGDNKLIWRCVFAVSAVIGMYFSFRLLTIVRKSEHTGWFARSRWVVVLLYFVVLVISLFPELIGFSGLKPIQIEAFLLTIIILTGHGLAWEMMTSYTEE